MGSPVVFISHSRIVEAQLDPFRTVNAQVLRELESEKPRTVAQLAYLSHDSTEVDLVHVFPDVDGLNRHLEGVEERTQLAMRYIAPHSYEIYGELSGEAATMRDRLAATGRSMTTAPEFLGGFLRLAEG